MGNPPAQRIQVEARRALGPGEDSLARAHVLHEVELRGIPGLGRALALPVGLLATAALGSGLALDRAPARPLARRRRDLRRSLRRLPAGPGIAAAAPAASRRRRLAHQRDGCFVPPKYEWRARDLTSAGHRRRLPHAAPDRPERERASVGRPRPLDLRGARTATSVAAHGEARGPGRAGHAGGHVARRRLSPTGPARSRQTTSDELGDAIASILALLERVRPGAWPEPQASAVLRAGAARSAPGTWRCRGGGGPRCPRASP